MDTIMEKDKSLAREIVRRLLDAWRLKRAYKYRSEKRITHRKLYFSLMRQLMHEIGQRNLNDIIMQRIAFFNHNFMTSLAIDQFHDLMSEHNKPQEHDSSEKVIEAGKSEMQQSTKQGVISDNILINADKSNDSGSESGYEIKSTDALRNLSLYQYDPEHDNEEILSSIKEIEREEEDEVGNEKTEDANAQAFGDLIDMKTKIEHELESQDDTKAIPKEGESNKKTNVKELLPDNEELRMKLEPMLVYRDDPDIYVRVIALDIRGKKFKVSNDGKCPRCHHYRNVFVILDFLFPMGDMPEICSYLIAMGQAVLWSSQDDSHCKDPPTMLCRGKCPTDPAKCGFNLNWSKTNLERIFFFPIDEEQPKTPPCSKTEQTEEAGAHYSNDNRDAKSLADSGSISNSQQELLLQRKEDDENDMNGFDDGQIDMKHYKSNISWVVLDDYTVEGSADIEREDDLIKTMLAISSAKEDWKNGDIKFWSDDSDLEQEKVDISDKPIESSSGTTNITQSTQSYAFSWDSYGSNPWANADPNKKKSQSSESKLVMIATGKAHVPKLLNPIQAHESDGENKTISNEEEKSGDTNTVTDSIEKSAAASQDLQTIETPAFPLNAGVSEDKTIPEGNESSNTKQRPYTADDYPVSKDGKCPYCKSAEVVYIIIDYKEGDGDDKNDDDLPDILKKLLDYQLAYKMPKDENEPPSFQCRSCTYGFNLDWRSTDLETIFGQRLERAQKEPSKEYGLSQTGANVKSEGNMSYNASGHGYHMATSTGYPAVYFPSPFLGFYPPMGMASMPYPSYYPQQFMPGYFASPGYPAYMPQPSNTPYPTANGPSYGPRGSHLTHGQGPSKNRERGATQVNRRSEETKPRDSSSTGITESKSTEEGVDGRWLNQKDGDKKQDSTAGGQGGETNGTWDNVAETNAISESKQSTSNEVLDASMKNGDVGNFVEEQPSAPGVDATEDKVVFAPKEKNQEMEEGKVSKNQPVEAKEPVELVTPDVVKPTSPNVASSSLTAVEVDGTVSSEASLVSVKESNTLEVPEVNEGGSTTEDVEPKRSRLEDPGASDDEKATIDDEETEATVKRTTRSKARARGRGRGRARGRGRGKGKGKTSSTKET